MVLWPSCIFSEAGAKIRSSMMGRRGGWNDKRMDDNIMLGWPGFFNEGFISPLVSRFRPTWNSVDLSYFVGRSANLGLLNSQIYSKMATAKSAKTKVAATKSTLGYHWCRMVDGN
jgi:hypothetical protein